MSLPRAASGVVLLWEEPGRVDGGPGVLVTEPTGYRLDTDGDVVDAREFERLIQRGRGQLDGGDAAGAVRALDGALVLWRGSPLLDFRDMHFASHEMHRLETLRADAVDARFDAALRLGKSAELIGDLEFELTNNPLRERLWWHLMLAMYRSGRRTDALRAYERAQAVLDGELGVAPGLALQRLASDVRHQSAELDWRPTSSTAGWTEAVGSGPTRLFGRSAETQRLRRPPP